MAIRTSAIGILTLCLLAGWAGAADHPRWIGITSQIPQKAEVKLLSATPGSVTLSAVLPGLESMVMPAGMVGTDQETLYCLHAAGVRENDVFVEMN